MTSSTKEQYKNKKLSIETVQRIKQIKKKTPMDPLKKLLNSVCIFGSSW